MKIRPVSYDPVVYAVSIRIQLIDIHSIPIRFHRGHQHQDHEHEQVEVLELNLKKINIIELILYRSPSCLAASADEDPVVADKRADEDAQEESDRDAADGQLLRLPVVHDLRHGHESPVCFTCFIRRENKKYPLGSAYSSVRSRRKKRITKSTREDHVADRHR